MRVLFLRARRRGWGGLLAAVRVVLAATAVHILGGGAMGCSALLAGSSVSSLAPTAGRDHPLGMRFSSTPFSPSSRLMMMVGRRRDRNSPLLGYARKRCRGISRSRSHAPTSLNLSTQPDKEGTVTRILAKLRPNLGIANELGYLSLAAVVGLLTGVLVTTFKLCIGYLKEYLFGDFVGQLMEVLNFLPFSVALGLVPIVGGAAVSLMRISSKSLTGSESMGPGLAGIIEEEESGSPFNPRQAILKAVAAIVTLGSGNSLGPEGPAVELGFASSRFVTSMTSKLSQQRKRIIMGAGAAAGVAAGFNAPVAAVFFALEVVGDLFSANPPLGSKAGVAATLLSAAIGTIVAKIGLNEEYSLAPAPYSIESPLVELPFYLLLGVASGLVAIMFKSFITLSTKMFKGKLPGTKPLAQIPPPARPIVGAAFVALVSAWFPQILFFGYETLDALLDNTSGYTFPLLVTLCVVKALTTAVCVSSGLVGGTFAPSLFLGATAGAAYHKVIFTVVEWARSLAPLALPSFAASWLSPAFLDALPDVLAVADAPAYAMVGAASVLGAVYRAPLTSSLLLFELTRDYEIILPLMASAGVATVITILLQKEKTVTEDIAQMGESVESGFGAKAKSDGFLRSLVCQEACMPSVVGLSPSVTIRDAIGILKRQGTEFALVLPSSVFEQKSLSEDAAVPSDSGFILMPSGDAVPVSGIISSRDLLTALGREEVMGQDPAIETVADIYRKDYYSAGPQDSLSSAQAIMDSLGVRFIPLVENLGGGQEACTGVVSLESLRVAVRMLEATLKLKDVQSKLPENAAATPDSKKRT